MRLKERKYIIKFIKTENITKNHLILGLEK